jgi:hypothetical protein
VVSTTGVPVALSPGSPSLVYFTFTFKLSLLYRGGKESSDFILDFVTTVSYHSFGFGNNIW